MQGTSGIRRTTITIMLIYFATTFMSLYILHRLATRNRVAPSNVPWVALKGRWFCRTRAHWRELRESNQNLQEGYERYSKRGRAFVSPNFTHRPQVVLAPSHIKWMMEQPDDVLSINEVLKQNVQFSYTSPHSFAFGRPFHIEALNKMRLDAMTSIMVDEISRTVDGFWGLDVDKWTRVSISSSSWAILSAITNRVFVGLPLAHTEEYAYYSRAFVQYIAVCAFIISNGVPAILKPILGRLIAMPARYYDQRCSTYLKPVIKEHLEAAASLDQTLSDVEPTDMLQHLCRFALKSSHPEDRDPQSICSRLLALNFVGIHTSNTTFINCILDVTSTDPSVWLDLRKEAALALREAGGKWTKSAVNRLVRIDSTFRESMRISTFKARGVEREVVTDTGVTLPDGTFLPKGTKIGLPTTGIQGDGDFYDCPAKFNPFRFVGKSELGMVNTNETFLAFGLGRHACPGRFFSAHELKLLLAYVVLNYDVEGFEKRPVSVWRSDFITPPNVELKVKRRAKSAHLDDGAEAN